jgi:hypothetical protein
MRKANAFYYVSEDAKITSRRIKYELLLRIVDLILDDFDYVPKRYEVRTGLEKYDYTTNDAEHRLSLNLISDEEYKVLCADKRDNEGLRIEILRLRDENERLRGRVSGE